MEEEEQVPETPQGISEDGEPLSHSEVIRSHLVWTPDLDVDLQYKSACFCFSDTAGEKKVCCVLIAEIHSRLLVAVPHPVWHRSLSNRILPARCLSKTVLLSLAACDPTSQEVPLEGIFTKAWIGFLGPEWEEAIQPDSGEVLDFQFWSEDGTTLVLPFGQALVEVADDKFSFATASSTAARQSRIKPRAERRIGNLESAVAGIQDGMKELLEQLRAPQTSSVAPKTQATPKRAIPEVKVAPLPPREDFGLPGLDRSVVQAALQAGVSRLHLEEMSRVVQRKSGKLADLPARQIPKTQNVLGESEDEPASADPPDAVQESAGSADPISTAVLKLTSIMEALNDSKKKHRDLDDLLDDPSGLDGGSHNLVTSGNNRRQAAILKALQRSLLESPEQIFKKIEQLMLVDFGSREAIPGEPVRHGSFRGWLEHRSRIPNLGPTVRISWAVAGALDAARAGNHMECQARLGLLLAAIDQVACDRGQWLLASEVLMESSSPPFGSFSRHTPPEFGESPHSRLLDSRWVDALMFRVKELDDYAERRSKLSKIGKGVEEDKKSGEGGPDRDKKKPGGKGKKGGGGEEAPKKES